ncbi:MAG: Holliday junction resolvase RuvX [Chloroflexota bacterium]
MRILCIDPGDRRIGLAISDPTNTLARPYKVIRHVNRQADAAALVKAADEEQVELIVVGQATDFDGRPNLSGRKSRRLAGAIRTMTEIPVILWDESYSTRDAQRNQKELGSKKATLTRHMDDRAAAIILQSYLDAQADNK